MATQEDTNKEIVRRTWEGLFNDGNLDLANQLIAQSFVNHAAPGAPPGPAAFRQIVTAYRTAFPDARFEIEQLLAEGEYVAMLNTFSGTHRGPFMGAAPTGKHVSQQQMHMVRVQHGQVVEHTAVRDDLALLEQLGAIERR